MHFAVFHIENFYLLCNGLVNEWNDESEMKKKLVIVLFHFELFELLFTGIDYFCVILQKSEKKINFKLRNVEINESLYIRKPQNCIGPKILSLSFIFVLVRLI